MVSFDFTGEVPNTAGTVVFSALAATPPPNIAFLDATASTGFVGRDALGIGAGPGLGDNGDSDAIDANSAFVNLAFDPGELIGGEATLLSVVFDDVEAQGGGDQVDIFVDNLQIATNLDLASLPAASGGGVLYTFAANTTGLEVRFQATDGNDDFFIRGFEADVLLLPLPGAGLMLAASLAGLAGLGIAGRRRKGSGQPGSAAA
ncbi:hypothetical protein LNKW23_00780 [Paralimibaculum aggregatum]|uniref:PEP-CTERM sorting domain-containing protein n=1 Tax=Paralimibaculum aggregatum TaxID=3036245 RepID=A0ABQ6LBU3_9RHOB|nr:hypothetical protein LNKW23_00780 [Limibaculum sp. NKW23]